MYKNIVAAVVGFYGLVMLAIGSSIVLNAPSTFLAPDFNQPQIKGVSQTFYALGISNALSSIFSFAAMLLIFRGIPAARILSYLIGASLMIISEVFFAGSGITAALYFIGLRGLIIVILTTSLRKGEA